MSTAYRRWLYHERTADLLRGKPGQWVKIGAYIDWATANAIAHKIGNGTLRSYLPPGAFETQVRPNDAGMVRVAALYARYLPEDDRCAHPNCHRSLTGKIVMVARDGRRFCKPHWERLPWNLRYPYLGASIEEARS
jgi:hypothetical protein